MCLSTHGTILGTYEGILLNIICSRTAHVDQIHQLAWRAVDQTSNKELATCSEDGTLKILIVHVGVH